MSEWIDVKDRMPEDDEIVLCFNERVRPDLTDAWTVRRSWGPGFSLGYATHWMPLPEPPKNVGHAMSQVAGMFENSNKNSGEIKT
jgi:hypothetical protein